MGNRINPYTRLLSQIKKYVHDIQYRQKIIMWRYPKNKLNDSWNLKDLYERTAAAGQLGYEVKLIASDAGLEIHYIKEIAEAPYEWRYR